MSDQLLQNTNTLTVGTTLSTNSLVSKKGAKCCLLYTKGFRDIPELGKRIPKDDIYDLSDTIAVIYEGEIMGIYPRDEVKLEQIGLLMAGVKN